MITKAVVMATNAKGEVLVKIPVLDNQESWAPISTIPNCDLNLSAGDIVFVSFEENFLSTPVVVGSLSTSTKKNAKNISLDVYSIDIEAQAKLPENTSIGNITSAQLKLLENIDENVKESLDNINKSIDTIIDNVDKNYNDLNTLISTVDKKIDKKTFEPIILTENVSFGKTLPTDVKIGQLFFLIEEET